MKGWGWDPFRLASKLPWPSCLELSELFLPVSFLPHTYLLVLKGSSAEKKKTFTKYGLAYRLHCYLIAKPNHSSSTYQFIELISKAKAGEMIKAPDRTIADLIKRSNLSGEIRKIFFCKSSTYEVKFNGLNILGEATDRVNVTQLVKEVSKLHQG
ncbi:MAG: hypothetical protein EB127_18700 [Alphaproteobacteria bacterium]|nr:hypothetical protein [Alphaproteobacteria bacterium]